MERINWREQIPSTVPFFDPMTYERQRVDAFNASPGAYTELDCPRCHNKGIILHLRDDGTRYVTDCVCRKTRNSVARMERSGLKNSIRDMTFDKFRASEDWQQLLKDGAMAYAKEGTGWFLICGQSGSGKTHLCTAICRERLLRGEDVHYMSWREEVTALKSLSGEDPQRQKQLQRLKTVPLLYIDDLFKTGNPRNGMPCPTAADINLAFEILNYRCINHLQTIISTEMQMHEMMDADEALCSRIIEQAGSHHYAVKLDRKRNYRLRNVTVL